MKKIILGFCLLALAFGCQPESKESKGKQVAKEAQNAFFKTYDENSVKEYFAENYIQHNPNVPTGIAPILYILPKLKEDKTTSRTHRMLQDGDFIVMHNTYNNAEGFGAKQMVAFDVWRLENGKVAEHWDNLASLMPPNPSGHTQVDGKTKITDIEKTAENKQFVTNFVKDVLIDQKGEKFKDYISDKKYIQHNSNVGDGMEGLQQAMEYFQKNNLVMKYNKLHKVLGEGNFVLTISEGEFGVAPGKPSALYDLFRVEDGKIVEHWDVIQSIPTEMAHKNGKF